MASLAFFSKQSGHYSNMHIIAVIKTPNATKWKVKINTYFLLSRHSSPFCCFQIKFSNWKSSEINKRTLSIEQPILWHKLCNYIIFFFFINNKNVRLIKYFMILILSILHCIRLQLLAANLPESFLFGNGFKISLLLTLLWFCVFAIHVAFAI